jgi:Mor family transcriptional regulator
MLEQNGQSYYLSLAAAEARKLKVGQYARIYTELLPGSDRELLRNRPSPVVIIEKAHDSAASLEVNVADFLRNQAKYLRRGIGGRSFYIMTGKVMRVSPPERDALDDGF